MAKTSATEAPPAPTPEAVPSEVPEETQVEAAPVEEAAPAAPVQEEQKPDVKAILAELPKEERKRLLTETLGDELQTLEQTATDRAYARLQEAQHREQRANEGLQTAVRNVNAETDENKQAQHIAAFARTYAAEHADEVAKVWRNYFNDALRQTFGLTEGQYKAVWTRVHAQIRESENRDATDADFLAHMMGEKFMPKTQMSKEQREEMAALVEEAVGKRLAGQPAPVSLGPGEAGGKEPDVAAAQGQEAKKAAFEQKWGFKPLT